MDGLKPIDDAFLMQAMVAIGGLEKTKEIIIYRQVIEEEVEEMILRKEAEERHTCNDYFCRVCQLRDEDFMKGDAWEKEADQEKKHKQ